METGRMDRTQVKVRHSMGIRGRGRARGDRRGREEV